MHKNDYYILFAYEYLYISSFLFKEIACKYIKNGIENEMMRFIEKDNIIKLEDINLPIEKALMGRYYLGFNRNAFLKDQVIRKIDIKSNAYKIDLRNGQKIIGSDCPKGKGDSNQIMTIKTMAGIFKFKPEHYSKIAIYQLKTALLVEEEKQFNKLFGIK
jgi:hypothetical protein